MVKEKEKPLTRKDVLKKIEENGGTAKGLNLSGKEFEEGIILRNFDLRGANLARANLKKALLANANLKEADLSSANLQGAKCGGIDLRNAILVNTDLRGANLAGADMCGVHFASNKFDENTDFININWGSKRFITKGLEHTEERTYRDLKNWHNKAGMYDIAGDFFCQEMTAKRSRCWLDKEILTWFRKKGLPMSGQWRAEYLRGHLYPFKPRELLKAIFPRKPLPWARLMLYDFFCGYGEKPWKVIVSATAIVCGLALIYFAIGTLTPNTFLDSLYYSAVSFTALGYGSWAPQPTGWVKGLGAFESFIGVFMMALFLVTFIRKMTR